MGIHETPRVVDESDDEVDEELLDEMENILDEDEEMDGLNNESLEEHLTEMYEQHSGVGRADIPAQNASSPVVNSCIALPEFLQNMIPSMEIKGNSKGGRSLIQSLCLKFELNFDDLHNYSTKLLIGKGWANLKHHFKYPVQMLIENQLGEKRHQKIAHQYELFDFLKTEEYKDAKNTGDAELELLSSVIQQPIHLLVHEKRGFRPGTSEVERCEIRTINPNKILMEKNIRGNKFAQQQDVYLLYNENKLHFQLLVKKPRGFESPPQDVSPIRPERASSFIENLHSSLNPGPDNASEHHASESSGLLDGVHCSLFPGESDFETMMSTLPAETIEPRTTDKNPSGDKPPSESTSLGSHVSSSSVDSSVSSLRRSSRICRRKEREDELFRMLQRPTASTEQREKLEAKRLTEFQKKRKIIDSEHQKEVEATNKDLERHEDFNLRRNRESCRLRVMGEKLRDKLSAENIKEIIHDNMEYFKNMEAGIEESWRYNAYQEGKDQELILRQIGSPFTDEQQEVVFAEVQSVWLRERIMDRFVDVVIIPEVFIRIYQVFFNLSKEQAESNISKTWWSSSSDL